MHAEADTTFASKSNAAVLKINNLEKILFIPVTSLT